MKIGSLFFQRNNQEINVENRSSVSIQSSSMKCEGFEKEVHCKVLKIKLNSNINFKNLNQGSADEIFDQIMEPINRVVIRENLLQNDTSSDDLYCLKAAFYITINEKNMPFLTNLKIEDNQNALNDAVDENCEGSSDVNKNYLMRIKLDEGFIRNGNLPRWRSSLDNLFGNGFGRMNDRNTTPLIYGIIDSSDVRSYQDEVDMFKATLENLNQQIRDKIMSSLKPESNIDCSCAVM